MGTWPFLISRSRDADYQVIMSPDFLVRAKRDQMIQKILGEKAQEISTELKRKNVKEPGYENLHIVYKTEPAKLEGNELRDRAGRRILRIYGLVFENGSSGADEETISRLFSQASGMWDDSLASFWKENKEREPIASANLMDRKKQSGFWKIAAFISAGALVLSIVVNILLFWELQKTNGKLSEWRKAAEEMLRDRKPQQPNPAADDRKPQQPDPPADEQPNKQ